jgi:hypothetical protein
VRGELVRPDSAHDLVVRGGPPSWPRGSLIVVPSPTRAGEGRSDGHPRPQERLLHLIAQHTVADFAGPLVKLVPPREIGDAIGPALCSTAFVTTSLNATRRASRACSSVAGNVHQPASSGESAAAGIDGTSLVGSVPSITGHIAHHSLFAFSGRPVACADDLSPKAPPCSRAARSDRRRRQHHPRG